MGNDKIRQPERDKFCAGRCGEIPQDGISVRMKGIADFGLRNADFKIEKREGKRLASILAVGTLPHGRVSARKVQSLVIC